MNGKTHTAKMASPGGATQKHLHVGKKKKVNIKYFQIKLYFFNRVEVLILSEKADLESTPQISDVTSVTGIRQPMRPAVSSSRSPFLAKKNKTPTEQIVITVAPSLFPWFPFRPQPPARYWQEPQKKGTDENKVEIDGKVTKQAPLQRKDKNAQKAKKRKPEEVEDHGKKFISGVRLFCEQLSSIASAVLREI